MILFTLAFLLLVPNIPKDIKNENQLEINKNIENIEKKDIKTKNSGFWSVSFIHISFDNWSLTDVPWIQNRTGTPSDPHKIENVTLNGDGTGYGILIEESTDHFIIKNCTINNFDRGIRLSDTYNGSIINNTLSDNIVGLYLSGWITGTGNNTISNNTIKNNEHAILLEDSCNNNTISENYISQNDMGITIKDCDNNTILENIINANENWKDQYKGISIRGTNNKILGNNMTECGIEIFRYATMDPALSFEEIASNTIDNRNNVNGRLVYYYLNEKDLKPNNFSNAGQVILLNCNDSEVVGLEVSHSSTGISLHNCYNNTISNNKASFGSIGVDLYHCNNNTISNNNASFGSVGVYLYYSNNNTIFNNNASYGGYGIRLHAVNDTLVLDNNVNNNINEGIELWIGTNNTIIGNNAIDNDGHGIILNGGVNITVTDNVANLNQYGIFLANSYNITIIGNTANDNLYGIYLTDTNYSYVADNQVMGNWESIYESPTCVGNVFINNQEYPISSNPSGNDDGDDGDDDKEGNDVTFFIIIILLISFLAIAASIAGIILLKKSKEKLKAKQGEIEELKQLKEEMTEDDILILKEKRFCLVHRGPIEGYNFICPECSTYYCMRCVEAIIDVENRCWSCGKVLNPDKPIHLIQKEDEFKKIPKEDEFKKIPK